jgi:hypothetical protein
VFGWSTIPDPYGRLFLADDGATPVPAPPADFPWPNAPVPTTVTVHTPGQYTLTRTLAGDTEHDTNEDDDHLDR